MAGVNDTRPNYRRMADYYAEQIAAGQLRVGDKLPGLPALEEKWGVSSTTVKRMWEEMESCGLVERQPGRGVVVIREAPAEPLTLEVLERRLADMGQRVAGLEARVRQQDETIRALRDR